MLNYGVLKKFFVLFKFIRTTVVIIIMVNKNYFSVQKEISRIRNEKSPPLHETILKSFVSLIKVEPIVNNLSCPS